MTRTRLAAVVLFGVVGLAAVAVAQTPSFSTFDNKSNRIGYGVVAPNGRFDLYDKGSNHTGYGYIDRGRTTAPRLNADGAAESRRVEGGTVQRRTEIYGQGGRANGKTTTVK